jgi:hypothetical protein
MKRRCGKCLVVFSTLALFFSACYKDVISPGSDPNGPPQFVKGNKAALRKTNRLENIWEAHQFV